MVLRKVVNFRNFRNTFNYVKYFSSAAEVKIVEVGPRDGLQNEPEIVPTNLKIEFINKLSNTGLKSIEVASFVSPKWVPQMSDNKDVFSKIEKSNDIDYPVLVPNLKGLESALSVGVKEIAVFASASEGFSRKNTNCSIEESLQRIKQVTDVALSKGIKVRGYVSCVVGCPYDGHVNPAAVANLTSKLLDLGCYEISLGDTIGVGTTKNMKNMLKNVMVDASYNQLAMHCHDTFGQALVNICTALEHGITVIDSSVSGLGGCPYAKGASGNVATEDLLYFLDGIGVKTGVDLNKLIEVGQFISQIIKKPTASKVNRALYKKL